MRDMSAYFQYVTGVSVLELKLGNKTLAPKASTYISVSLNASEPIATTTKVSLYAWAGNTPAFQSSLVQLSIRKPKSSLRVGSRRVTFKAVRETQRYLKVTLYNDGNSISTPVSITIPQGFFFTLVAPAHPFTVTNTIHILQVII